MVEEYISGEYTSQGIHLVLRNTNLIAEIERKLSRILFDEERHPNKYEQNITSLYSFLKTELDDYNSMTATDYLLSNPANAAHVRESLQQAEEGKFAKIELADL